ncbi:hypothetical protein K2X05_02580 [bacterium]|nr:hypothetical protein [bacterium]
MIKKALLFFLVCFVFDLALRFSIEPYIDQKLLAIDSSPRGSIAEEVIDKIGGSVDLNSGAPKLPHPYFGYIRPLGDTNSPLNSDIYGFIERPELVSIEKKEDFFYIGVFGGSVAAQLVVAEKKYKILTNHLMMEFPELKNKKISILSFAYDGYRQPQQFIISSFFLEKLDLIINIDGVNDIFSDLSPHFPSYYPTNMISQLYFSNQSYDDFYNNAQMVGTYLQIVKLKNVAIKMPSSTLRIAIKSYTLNLWNTIFDTFRDNEIKPGKWPQTSKDTTNKENIYFWAQFIKKQFYLARAFKKPIFFVVQPVPFIDREVAPQEEKNLLLPLESSTLTKNIKDYHLLLDKSRELYNDGLPIIDMSSVFKKNTEAIFRDDCCHMNSVGNKIFLNVVSKKIITLLRKNNEFKY